MLVGAYVADWAASSIEKLTNEQGDPSLYGGRLPIIQHSEAVK